MINSNISTDDFELVERKLYPIFSQLQNKKIFITGGTGFFGKWLLEVINYLNINNDLSIKAIVLSRNPEKFLRKFPYLTNNISLIKGNINTLSSLDFEIDYIIHAATDVSQSREYNRLYESVLNGTKNVCNLSNKVNCKKFLYISSGAAYGTQPAYINSLVEGETYNEMIKDEYGRSKLDSENYLKENLLSNLTIARCFTFSGPHLPLDGKYAFGNFISDKLKGRTISINSTGRSIRSYLYAADLVIWLITIMIKGENKNIYNVGSDVPFEIIELAYAISDDVNLNYKDNQKSVYIPSINKAKETLGLDVYTDLYSSICKTIVFNK